MVCLSSLFLGHFMSLHKNNLCITFTQTQGCIRNDSLSQFGVYVNITSTKEFYFESIYGVICVFVK